MSAVRTAALPADLVDLRCWHDTLRAEFPQLDASQVAYLDSAATSQKPTAVLAAVHDYLTTTNANAGRGSYPWANRTTELVEQARDHVRGFLGDPDPTRSGVDFVSGTTEGLRRVAEDWLAGALRDGDEIVVPVRDHRANVVPWHDLVVDLARRGVRVTAHAMPYEPSGDYDLAALADLVGPRTRFVAATHVHHVFGADMNVGRLRRVLAADTVICLDAAQGVGHLPISVDDLDVDFVVFSGHKAMALPGVGAIWSRNQRTARFTLSGWSGTPNTAGIVSLSAALAWLAEAGTERVHRWTTALGAVLTDALAGLHDIEVLGCQESLRLDSSVQRRQGLVAFRHDAVPAGDLGFWLEERGFYVRADHHCQAGGDERPSVRVSTHAYTSVDEVVRLVEALRELEESTWHA